MDETTIMLITGISTLGGVIAFLGKWIMKKLDDCESDRYALWTALADRTGGHVDPEDLQRKYSAESKHRKMGH